MAERKDWFPVSRALILIMARVWANVLAMKWLLWGIQNALIKEFHDRIAEAQTAFDAASATTRSAELTADINAAFDKLEALMRYLKDRYFKKPPLFDDDFEALLLAPKDGDGPKVPRPTSRVIIALYYEGQNTVVVDTNLMPGDLPPLDCYMEVFRGVMPRTENPLREPKERDGKEDTDGLRPRLMRAPSSGNELFKWLDTYRKRERAFFAPEERGKVAYFCARYVNEKGEAGPWGPVAAIMLPATTAATAPATKEPPPATGRTERMAPDYFGEPPTGTAACYSPKN